MERVKTSGAELEYESWGTGEPVVFIHGALIADTFRPLFAEPNLSGRYRMTLYHRRGYAGCSPVTGPVSIMEQADDCRALLDHMGLEQAHIVGHSYGGAIALQLALDTPERVSTLSVLEPALMFGESAQGYRAALLRGIDRFQEIGAEAIVDEFLKARWDDYRAGIDRILPGAIEQAVHDAATTFECELPALLEWRFGEDELRRISQPTLSVLGGDSEALSPRFGEAHRQLLEWLPDAEGYILPDAAHFLHVQNPGDMARRFDRFWTDHAIRANSG